MLSLNNPINDIEIADVQVIRSGTVYKLIGHSGEVLVLKVESSFAVNNQQLKHAKFAMKTVDSKAGKVKALAASEIQALKDWVDFMKRVTNDFADNMINNFSAGQATLDLSRVLDLPLWYKMPLADLTDADKLLEARLGVGSGGQPDKSVMQLFLDGLKSDGGLEQIGKIIAADMYIGNSDRFNPNEGSEKHYGNKKINFKCVKNPGNVFMIGKNTQQRIAFSGHDFLDPNSGYRNYDMSLSEVKSSYDEEWLGYTLCNKNERKKFAKNIIHDLETILTPNRKSFSPFRKLGDQAYKRVENGMLQGMRDIVNALNGPKLKSQPKGVQERRDAFAKALLG